MERRAKGGKVKGYTDFLGNQSSRISTQKRKLFKF